MPAHNLTPWTSKLGDDEPTCAEHLGPLRSQVAVVRALADEVECLLRAGDAEGLGDQLIEEMARLGCRLLETAGAFAGPPPCEQSGVFARPRSAAAEAPPLRADVPRPSPTR